MKGLLFREAPAKQHTIPHGVISHVELDAYAPWDDERWGAIGLWRDSWRDRN
jgi:hypothetical protein